MTHTNEALVAEAKALIQKQFVMHKHHVACVLEGMSGVYQGLHIDTVGIDTCAEPVALAVARLSGENAPKKIVSAYWHGDVTEGPKIVSPCGNCRQLLLEHCPDISVLIENEGEILAIKVEDLLPLPYQRP